MFKAPSGKTWVIAKLHLYWIQRDIVKESNKDLVRQERRSGLLETELQSDQSQLKLMHLLDGRYDVYHPAFKQA